MGVGYLTWLPSIELPNRVVVVGIPTCMTLRMTMHEYHTKSSHCDYGPVMHEHHAKLPDRQDDITLRETHEVITLSKGARMPCQCT